MKYDIIRINTKEKTLTVLFNSEQDHTLQQDVPVDNFTDMPAIEQAIAVVMEKYEADLKSAREGDTAEIHPDLQALVDKHTS